MDRRTRTWIVVATVAVLSIAILLGVGVYGVNTVLRSGVTRPIDNMFGDQHLKTVVALVELHKVRYGTYPRSPSDLRFTGEWDAIALGTVSYCASADGRSYYVDVQRGWAARPALKLPLEFWRGTGFKPELGPCR